MSAPPLPDDLLLVSQYAGAKGLTYGEALAALPFPPGTAEEIAALRAKQDREHARDERIIELAAGGAEDGGIAEAMGVSLQLVRAVRARRAKAKAAREGKAE